TKGKCNLILLSIGNTGLKVLHNLTDDPAEIIAVMKSFTDEKMNTPSVGEANVHALQDIPGSARAPISTRELEMVTSGMTINTGSGESTRKSKIFLIINSLIQVAEFFSGIPGHKSLIMFSYYVPFNFHRTTD